MKPGDEFELKVTPDRYLTVRYAGASGDFNPIHIDEEFARQVGLPGRILHGLWTMAQVARAHTEALGGPDRLERLSVQFRGMGQLEQEIVVTGSVERGQRRPRHDRAPRPSRTASGSSATPRPTLARLTDARRESGRAPARSSRGRRPTIRSMLTERQELVLSRLVQDYLEAGHPWAQRRSSAAFDWGPSTIRHELANLEELGLLAHPHTSAGRMPTEAGYRYFVDRLLPAEAPASRALSLSLVRREVDEAMRVTTEALSQVTDLLAIVTAPPIDTSTIRHVEVLALQPQVLMVVVITSTGGVTKRLFTFPQPGRHRAGRLGRQLSQRAPGRARARGPDAALAAPRSVPERDRGRVHRGAARRCSPSSRPAAQSTLYIDGTSRLLSGRMADVSDLNLLMDMLERRVALLEVLRSALSAPRDVAVRIGTENEVPALRSLALVAAGYGLPQRTLGSVSVIGPLRMDYGHAIRAVREAAAQLSCLRGRRLRPPLTSSAHACHPRLLRDPRRAPRRRRGRDQEGVPPPGPRAAPRRQQPRPAGRGQVQGGRRGLRGPLRRRAPGHL